MRLLLPFLQLRARHTTAGFSAQGPHRRARAVSVLLWSGQVMLALLFLFAGGMKLVLPLEMLSGPITLPGWFLRFIGVAEVLGAIGLVGPSVARIRPGLAGR